MALNMAQARVQITAQTQGQQDVTQLEREIARLQGRLTSLQGTQAGATSGMNAVTVSAGQQRAGMQQLSFQIGDVATQFASGTSPMMIFAQQGSQVVQALSMMQGGASGLLGILGGPWGAILMAGSIALTPIITKLLETSDAADTASNALDGFLKKQRQARAGAVEETQALIGLNQARDELLQLDIRLAKRPRGADGKPLFSYADLQRQQELRWKVAEFQGSLDAIDAQRDATAKADKSEKTKTPRVRSAGGGSRLRSSKAQKDKKEEKVGIDWSSMRVQLPDADIAGMVEDLGRRQDSRMEDRNATARNRSLQAMREYGADIADIGKHAFDAWSNALNSTEDALVNFAMTGKFAFKDLANSIIADLMRVAIQQAIMAPLTGWFKGLLSGNGSAFDAGGVRKFATGGVVSGPTPFAYAGGLGLMGEAGPEAIMPLRRLGNGRLGVESSGGGSGGNVQVNVSVEGGGSQVQGDPGKAAQLGKAIAAVVRAELVQQKRPGGLLAAG